VLVFDFVGLNLNCFPRHPGFWFWPSASSEQGHWRHWKQDIPHEWYVKWCSWYDL